MSGLIQVSGGAGSGKTQLALDTAIDFLLVGERHRVYWFTTKGKRLGFPSKRAKEVCEAKLRGAASKRQLHGDAGFVVEEQEQEDGCVPESSKISLEHLDEKTVADVLGRLWVRAVYDYDDAVQNLKDLGDIMDAEEGSRKKNFCCDTSTNRVPLPTEVVDQEDLSSVGEAPDEPPPKRQKLRSASDVARQGEDFCIEDVDPRAGGDDEMNVNEQALAGEQAPQAASAPSSVIAIGPSEASTAPETSEHRSLIIFDSVSDLDFADAKTEAGHRAQQLFFLANQLKKLERDRRVVVLVLNGVANGTSAEEDLLQTTSEMQEREKCEDHVAQNDPRGGGGRTPWNTKPALGLPWAYCCQQHISLWKRQDRACSPPVAVQGLLQILEKNNRVHGGVLGGKAGVKSGFMLGNAPLEEGTILPLLDADNGGEGTLLQRVKSAQVDLPSGDGSSDEGSSDETGHGDGGSLMHFSEDLLFAETTRPSFDRLWFLEKTTTSGIAAPWREFGFFSIEEKGCSHDFPAANFVQRHCFQFFHV
ncbi:unnamed protein product [Amoebophrya sp. A120]|nr:unnamed protein product [Amoebophrya sp. A120]|eukprot:GSA120T00004333001.1